MKIGLAFSFGLVLGFVSNLSPAAAACRNLSGGGSVCDGNTTITTGGTAQYLFGSVIPTTGYELQNPHATEDCWFSDSAVAAPNAAGSQRLLANGGWYETPPGKRPVGKVSLVCETTGHVISATRW